MAAPRSPQGILLLALATVRSVIVMARWRPRATLATGGYVSTPVALASWLLRIPVVLFLPDIVPGKAVAWLAPLSKRIAVGTKDAAHYLPREKTVITGYPVRETFRHASRAAGRKRFGIPDDARVLCVFGGSQGSRSINQALATTLPDILSTTWVIHICGEKRLEEAQAAAKNISSELHRHYLLFPYLHDEEMVAALAAADLAVCRSGASTIGELPLTETPAILVPLPEKGVHQRENAEYLARAGAGVLLEDADLARLGSLLQELLGDTERLAAMRAASQKLARPDASERIAALVVEVAA